MTRDEIKAIAIEFGFAINQDIIGFADRVLGEQFEQMRAEGWRQCAKGQHTSQFCGQLEAAVLAEREACAKVCEDNDSIWAAICAKDIRARRDGG